MYICVVQCEELRYPSNGNISCSLINSPMFTYEDTCNFTCNTGYELTGSNTRNCQSNGNWSGSPVSCIIMECTSSSLPMNSMLAESCSSTYQSMCELQCQEGFNGTGDPSYVCDVLSDGSSVMWMAEGAAWKCGGGMYVVHNDMMHLSFMESLFIYCTVCILCIPFRGVARPGHIRAQLLLPCHQ